MLTIQLVALEDGSAPRKLSPPHFLAWILFYYTARTPGTRSQNEKRFDTIGQAQLICWRICNTIKPGGVIAIIPHKRQGHRSLKKCIMKKGVFRPPGAYLSRLGWTLVL
ncbi:hypothetical protein RSOL_461230 [Rhizoctonia solani AG-3 Rhs1AP]|uniref:Uncharacterized protein n=1 Tax=Rhizoctonia solani AG-3 Rhs1AP TaxID=1086054 RepID=X8JGT8_9AGAM|nr:hypothetical protein RSOL_461230 [Rhizoctonia solani AG-3 Rhs1AP]